MCVGFFSTIPFNQSDPIHARVPPTRNRTYIILFSLYSNDYFVAYILDVSVLARDKMPSPDPLGGSGEGVPGGRRPYVWDIILWWLGLISFLVLHNFFKDVAMKCYM